MATYAIGDIQGCFNAFQRLLEAMAFDKKRDTLWFTGDLVNRGMESLAVLRYIKALGEPHVVVLGNHDLHLLAVAAGVRSLNPHDTLSEVLDAPDKEELLSWLAAKPLIHFDPKLKCVMTHAGIAPMWDLDKAIHLADELKTALQENTINTLQTLFGDQPNLWRDDLKGGERLRCIVNYLTRMRFCKTDGALDFSYKGTLAKKPEHLCPWFLLPQRQAIAPAIVFGHWAALGGDVSVPHLYALDTGCVWGNALTALRLDDFKRFSVHCEKP